MFGIGTAELIVFAIIGLFMIAGGVAALIVISIALRSGKKRNHD